MNRYTFSLMLTLFLITACGNVERLPIDAFVDNFEIVGDPAMFDDMITNPKTGAPFTGIIEQGKYEHDMCKVVDGRVEGPVSFLLPNGKPLFMFNYKNGQKEGVQMVADNTGQVLYEIGIKDSLYHGMRLEYREDGEPSYIGKYVHGEKDSIHVEWSSSERGVRWEGTYDLGQKVGTHYKFWDDDTLRVRHYDDEGNPIGVHLTFDVRGQLEEEEFHENGQRVLRKVYKFGELSREIPYKDGAWHGTVKEYRWYGPRKGSLSNVSEYADGELIEGSIKFY